jgi:hypothetical protein
MARYRGSKTCNGKTVPGKSKTPVRGKTGKVSGNDTWGIVIATWVSSSFYNALDSPSQCAAFRIVGAKIQLGSCNIGLGYSSLKLNYRDFETIHCYG